MKESLSAEFGRSFKFENYSIFFPFYEAANKYDGIEMLDLFNLLNKDISRVRLLAEK